MPSVALLLILLTPLTAQATVTTPIRPALTIKTVDADVAESIADTFYGSTSSKSRLPRRGYGDCYVLSVGGDARLVLTTENGVSSFLQMRAKPTELAEIFADQIGEKRQWVSAFAGSAAGGIGATPEELIALVEDVFAFPAQIEALSIDVDGSPRAGFNGTLDVLSTHTGWLSELIGEMRTNSAGAPTVADADALFRLSINMENTTLRKVARRLLGFAIGAAASDPQSKQKYAAMMQDTVGLFDGTMAMALASDGKGQKLLCGLLDARRLASLINSADFKSWRQANAEANPMADVEFVDAALTHRQVDCNKQVTEVSMPGGQNNKTTQFTGVAGSFLLGAASESDSRSLIDAILDQSVKRGPLPDNALFTMSARVAELVRALSNGMAGGEDMPASFDVALNKRDHRLNFTFKVGM